MPATVPFRSMYMAELAYPTPKRSGAPNTTAVEFSFAASATRPTSGPSGSTATSSSPTVVYPLMKSSGKRMRSASGCSAIVPTMVSMLSFVRRNRGLSWASTMFNAWVIRNAPLPWGPPVRAFPRGPFSVSFRGCIDAGLGRGLAEAAGEPGQPDHPQNQPDQAYHLGAAVQVQQQVEVYDRPRERQNDPQEYPAEAALRTVAQEVQDHAEVDQREGAESAEVDKRGRGGDVEEQRTKARDADERDRDRRGTEAGQNPAETVGQRAVAPHREQEPRRASLNSEPRGELADYQPGEEDRREQVAAQRPCQVERRGVDVFEGSARVDELREVGDADEQGAEEEDDDYHGARYRVARVAGLLCEQGEAVEPDIGVGRHGGAGGEGRERQVLVEERARQAGAGLPSGEIPDAQRHEDAEHEQLESHQQIVRRGRDPDADHVEDRGDEDEGHDPHRSGNGRKLRREVGRTDQPDHQRYEEVVEQDEPSRQEAEPRSHLPPDVGVGGARALVMHVRHPPVAVGGEKHRDERDEVGRRRGPVRELGDDPDRGQHDEGRYPSDPDYDDRAEPEGPLQRLLLRPRVLRHEPLFLVSDLAKPTSRLGTSHSG